MGETKRITLKVAAKQFSLGASTHPELRGWVAKIEGYYQKSGYAAAPSLNLKSYQTQNGGDLSAAFKSDVLAQERCDGLDNDCDQQVDEDKCGGDAGADAQVTLAPDAGLALDTTLMDDAADESENTLNGSGCHMANSRPAPSLLLGLPLLLLLRRRR